MRKNDSEGTTSPSRPSRLRCAIYTRKSTEEGLEQEFNSLDAQREAAEAFIQSQRREGWIALPQCYDDGGFTGANLDRPAVKRLLHAVEAGELDCVVVDKVEFAVQYCEITTLRRFQGFNDGAAAGQKGLADASANENRSPDPSVAACAAHFAIRSWKTSGTGQLAEE